MLPSRRHRLPALLLALVLVGGGIVLPVADALIFHALPGSPTTRETSIAGTGGQQGHQQICLQLKATGQTRAIPGPHTTLSLVPPAEPGPRDSPDTGNLPRPLHAVLPRTTRLACYGLTGPQREVVVAIAPRMQWGP
jgi:hypothetical protein